MLLCVGIVEDETIFQAGMRFFYGLYLAVSLESDLSASSTRLAPFAVFPALQSGT